VRLDLEMAEELGRLAEAVSRPDYAEALLGFLDRLIEADFTTMTRYSRYSKPEYVVHSDNYSAEMADRYLALYHRFDPFHGYWRNTERPGVVWLGDLSSAEVKRGRYVREFLSLSGVSDELGVFLPPLGGSSVALFLERATGRFSARDRQALNTAYPILAGLYRAHVNSLFQETAALPALPQARPVLVTDAAGNQIFMNGAWRAAADTLPDPADLAAQAQDGGAEGPHPVGEDRVLHRARLEPGFRLAPGGFIWVVEPLAKAPDDMGAGPAGRAAPFESVLTPRERQVVDLILAGHATVDIARRLGLSRGTVKNHRCRIYYKLDITTERELFLMYVESLSEPGRGT
jgi:DNA-binding CsgD family transcriptional regulator